MNRGHRRFLAPEVIQTSAMDCGPASLKCLLEGFGVPVSYGRLREACQTDVDGTSIDAIEAVANQLGLDAQQVMLPLDHLFLKVTRALPAMLVTCGPDGATHFVVVWRRVGDWLQVMDPATGRRWVTLRRFAGEIFRHRFRVPAAAWREWAGSGEFTEPLRYRLARTGASASMTERLVADALSDSGWRGLASLDAAVRLVQSLIDAGALNRGGSASDLLSALMAEARVEPDHDPRSVPARYWSVTAPVQPDLDQTEPQLVLHGAVLLRVRGRAAGADEAADAGRRGAELSPELRAALAESAVRPGRELLDLLRADGILTPVALSGAMLLAVGAVLVESLLFRGLFDVASQLSLASQRLEAIVGLEVFLGLLLLLQLPVARESLRLGRHLEVRLRMALLGKLSRLGDRYFQSRPVSDMAERSHNLHLTRLVPDLALRLVETGWDVIFTLIGIALVAPFSVSWALLIAFLAVVVPILFQPSLSERDMRMRSHSGALTGFYLDALLGLVAIRTHSAQRAVRNEHEALLTEWVRASRGMISLSVLAQGLQSVVCLGVAAGMLWSHFVRFGVTGSTLLLVYWTLKLPALGRQFHSLALQYPAHRNILLRLLEPLGAPEECPPQDDSQPNASVIERRHGVSVAITGGQVVASGHTLLSAIDLNIRAGEHVAIVGPSGAGKSTLIGLFLGWHRLAAGELTLDGESVDGSRLSALRRATAWVDPAVQLWNRPMLENLCFGRDAGIPENLAEVLQTADLRGLLEKLPKGLQSCLGEGGGMISGGEGQRVRLARALLQEDVRLALLDEPFRGLDRGQRRLMLEQTRDWWRHATLMCVTHDVSETLVFDRVLVVEEGRIVEDGIPKDLAERDSRYRRLLESDRGVRNALWDSAIWRRVRIDGGVVQAEGA